jgi:anaerobic selenocysteine-containing dehydrogenase
MTDKISRRDFLKVVGVSAAATAVLTGCGPASRYVVREPYTQMPEYTMNGQSTYYATTCRECPAGCGMIVRTMQGRALKVEGNKNHPVNLGKTCARGQASLQGLYNPDRNRNPLRQAERGSGQFTDLDWDEAVTSVKNALTEHQPGEIAFLMGLAPDHLYDLVSEITRALGAPPPFRYGAHEVFDARRTLLEAAKRLFSANALPFFDLANADVTFSFGANFLETFLSPVAYSRGFAQMRRGHPGRRGYLVQFEPRLSQTAAVADEWIPLAPGTEGLVALALGRLVAEKRGGAVPNAFLGVDVTQAAEISGVSEETLQRLADIFTEAEHPLAIPGGSAFGQSNGLEAATAVLAVNVLVENLGKPGGVFLTPLSPMSVDAPPASNSLQEVNDLIRQMRDGKVKVLFVHGANPIFELPSALGFASALAKVPLVISFASFPDETAMQADLILPDHTGLEAWGYQRSLTGGDRSVISGAQPVVAPFYNTRATADVLLAAVQAVGGTLVTAVPYQDEVAFLKQSLIPLVKEDGFYNAPEINTFTTLFQQYGGWWNGQAGLDSPAAVGVLNQTLTAASPEFEGEGEFYFAPFMSPVLGDGSGANKPWLQETPDPTTTVMWNSWVEINPVTADEFGLNDDDIVRISSSVGEIEAVVYRYPAIRPDTIAIPFGQGHTAYGRYAQGRGVNPLHLLGLKLNGAGDLAFGATRVKIEKTDRKQALSRLESRIGVYGDGLKE